MILSTILGQYFNFRAFDEELADRAINDLAKFNGTAKTVDDTIEEQAVVTVVQPILPSVRVCAYVCAFF